MIYQRGKKNHLTPNPISSQTAPVCAEGSQQYGEHAKVQRAVSWMQDS